jgi:hypothetical protein
MIQVSENAAKRIIALKSEDGAQSESFLRVFVKRGGCSGFSYKMEFDTVAKDNDKVFESNGAKVVPDRHDFGLRGRPERKRLYLLESQRDQNLRLRLIVRRLTRYPVLFTEALHPGKVPGTLAGLS